MLARIRRLHRRGAGSRGVVVDTDGAMLGPDCVLAHRMSAGFRCLGPGEAGAIQAAVLGDRPDPGWLFEQCRRIAAALAESELTLAQIYGLRIPIDELDDPTLRKLGAVAELVKAGFDPNQPRVPQGEPDAGQWTYEDGYAKPRDQEDGGGATNEDEGSGGNNSGDGEPSREAGGGDRPSMEYRLAIPEERPDTARERNSIVRRSAEWLRQAAALGALGAAFVPDPRIKAVLAVLEATAWVAEYLPEILSYLDGPKSLKELQDAAADPQVGYQIHHIVESQYNSINAESNSRRFGARLGEPDNLVRIPKWRHIEISSWYSMKNDEYGDMTPRAYLRGKSWVKQFEVGLRALRRFGVLK